MAHSLVTICVFFVLGIAASERMPHLPGPLAIAVAALIAVALLTRRTGKKSVTDATVLLLVLTLGALRAQVASPLFDPTHFVTQNAFGSGRFELEVTGDPIQSGELVRAPVAIRGVFTGNKRSAASGSARLVLQVPAGEESAIAYGDVLEIDGTLANPRDAYVGPGQHLKDLWNAEGVQGVLWTHTAVKVVTHTGGNPLAGAIYDLRHKVSGVLDQTHPPEVATFVRAVLLGMRDMPATPAETGLSATLADYKATGTYHLLSISGGHVGILALVLTTLLGPLFSRRMTGMLILFALGAYAVLAGGAPPVLRATVMAGVFIVGRMAYRPISVFTALAASALILLAAQPQALFLPGFQMSFLAVLAIAYLTPPLMTRFDYLPPYLNALLSTSLAATLGTAPILALSTGTLSLVAPLANVLVIPLFGIILPVSMAAVAGSLISPWIPFFCGAANYGFVTLFSGAVHVLARVPAAAVDVSGLSPNVWVAYGLGLVVIGDWYNLREMVAGRLLTAAAADPERPAFGEIDPAQLANTVRELASLLPEESEATDPISRRLAAVRGAIRGQIPDLAPEFMLRYNALSQESWAGSLDKLTLAYLAFADAFFLAARSPDKTPAMLLLIKALEHELNVHLFGPIRITGAQKNVSTLLVRYPNNALVNYLASPPRVLSLEEQHEILWSLLSNQQDKALKGLTRVIKRGLSSNLADPQFFLEVSLFPLRLDHVYKRFYLRLDKETWDWEGVRRARDLVLGPVEENLFEQIGRALSRPEHAHMHAPAAVAAAGAREFVDSSGGAGPAPDPGPRAGGVQEIHRLEHGHEQEVRDDQAHDDAEHDTEGPVDIHAGSSLKAVR